MNRNAREVYRRALVSNCASSELDRAMKTVGRRLWAGQATIRRVSAIAVILSAMVYVGAYCVLIDLGGHGGWTRIPYFVLPGGGTIADESRQRPLRLYFAPMIWIDHKLRPTAWEVPYNWNWEPEWPTK